MKHSVTTKIFVIVWASVLFASYVTGICIKEVRFKRARIASQAITEPEVNSEVQKPSETDKLVSELAQKRPMPGPGGPGGPGGAERPRALSPEDGAGFGGDRMAKMRERFEGMSEEEKRDAMAQMRERFGGRRREGGMRGRFENMSEEERARMEEERRQMRERFENMSEEEREEFRAQMRERSGGRRPPGDGQGGGEGGRRRPGDRRQENN